MKRVLGFLFGVLATLWMAAPAAAWHPTDTSEPGSVLVFYQFDKDDVSTVDQGDMPETAFEVSVVCPNNFDCSTLPFGTPLQGGNAGPLVTVHGHWVCPADPNNTLAPTTCLESDFEFQVTVKGTAVFDPLNILFGKGQAGAVSVAQPPCSEGYLILWVESGLGGQPIKFDGLIGDEVIRDGHFEARGLNAVAIQAADALNTFDPTAPDGTLHFDGNHYQSVTGKIYGSIRYDDQAAPHDINTSLILLTLDVDSNRPNSPTTVDLNFYNEGESLISAPATNFTCWGQVYLTNSEEFSNSFNVGLDQTFGVKGLVESKGATQGGTPVTLIGVVETEEEIEPTFDATGTTSFTVSAANIVDAITGLLAVAGCSKTGTIDAPTITCNLTVPATGSVALQRTITYPFYNDSISVETTTFLPH